MYLSQFWHWMQSRVLLICWLQRKISLAKSYGGLGKEGWISYHDYTALCVGNCLFTRKDLAQRFSKTFSLYSQVEITHFKLLNFLLDPLKPHGRMTDKFTKEIFPKNRTLSLQLTHILMWRSHFFQVEGTIPSTLVIK